MHFGSAPPLRAAFTLAEVLVSMAIIGVLIALTLPAGQRARESSRRINCLSNLRQLGVALHEFHGTFGHLPPGIITDQAIQDAYHTGFTYLLPYLEQKNVHTLYNYEREWYEPE